MSDDKKKKFNNPEKSEVRYVPIEYMPHMQEDDDEIDLLELANHIWDGRLTIAKITGVFVLFGLFIALFSPLEYESEAVLMPEVLGQQESRTGQLIEQFGGAFGLGAADISDFQSGSISPLIYPRIVQSISFQKKLIDHPIFFSKFDVTTTIPDFYENYGSFSLLQFAKKYTIKLPYTIINFFRSSNDPISLNDQVTSEFIKINKEELVLIENLRDRITVELDDETGLLRTNVLLADANAAAELNQFLIIQLKEFLIDYKLEKARQDLEFVEEQYNKAKERFENAQIQLADFRDSNQNITSARAQTALERLQDEKNLSFNLYNSLSQQLERSRLKLQEQTPVFKIVQDVTIRTDKVKPKRGFIVIMFTFFGGFFSVGYILLLPHIKKIWRA